MVDGKTRCKECYIKKCRLGWKKLLKKNKAVLVFVSLLWVYEVFPGPFIPGLDPMFYTITLVALLLIMTPICLALFFWLLNSPTSDVKKNSRIVKKKKKHHLKSAVLINSITYVDNQS